MRRVGGPPADAELIARTLSGDCQAFNHLYVRHVGAVRMAIRDNVHEPEAVADAVQDTFTRALERLPALREADRFRPWLLSIARHIAIDERRARQRAPLVTSSDPIDLEGDGPDPVELAELSELADLVNGCVGGLSSRDATAITLVTRFGFGPAEVAAAIGTSPGAAKVVVHRARRRLRDALTLELMVRAQSIPCQQFAKLRADDRLTAAATHVRGCALCQHAATEELTLYNLDPASTPAGHRPSIRT